MNEGNSSTKKWQRVDLNYRPRAYEALDHVQLLNKILEFTSTTELSLLSKVSKSYISQVKNGKRPPSQKLIDFLEEVRRRSQTKHDYLALFLQSREAMEVTPATMAFYRTKLTRFFREVNADTASKSDVEAFLIQFKTPGNRHAYHRVIQTFYNWRADTFDIPSPVKKLKAPRLGKPILPTLTAEQVTELINAVESNRDKAIIAMFTESGLRLNELINVQLGDIDWVNGTVQVLGKGNKEALAPVGKMAQHYLKIWLQEYKPKENIWGLNQWGVISMLRRLEQTTGLTCNPHVFRRTFACLLRKAGVDVMIIKELGRWESLDMVQRYTRSFNFQDSLKFYKGPLSDESTNINLTKDL